MNETMSFQVDRVSYRISHPLWKHKDLQAKAFDLAVVVWSNPAGTPRKCNTELAQISSIWQYTAGAGDIPATRDSREAALERPVERFIVWHEEGKSIMVRKFSFVVFFLILVGLVACGRKVDDFAVDPDPTRIPQMSVKVRVADVTNATRELYDVDVIGMLWNALNDSLYRRGLLWMQEADVPVLTVEARVVRYKKGHAVLRAFPLAGNVELAVECDVKQGGTLLETIESQRTISFGDEVFAKEAWRKIFSVVAEDVVSRISRRI